MASISSLSLQYVKVPVSAIEAGEVVDPTAATVAMAFTEVGASPESGDWNDASWETDATRTPNRYYARCLVGPGGAVSLAADTYSAWLKITGISPEVPVIRASDMLLVT